MTPRSTHHLLLAMLATRAPPSPDDFEGRGPSDWEAIARAARQHRLGPLLFHRFVAAGQRWPLPASLREEWQVVHRRAAARSLVMQHALVTVQDVLGRAGIPSAALKGAWLAWQAYDNPAMRPMRDIDLLVADGDAIRAHATLVAAGARPGPKSHVPIPHARAHHKHMPPLFWGDPAVNFEIHWRISRPRADEDRGAVIADHADMLARRIDVPVGSARVACLDPTDTLLHLVIHAVEDHRFDNGPIILSDIAATLVTATVDWSRFWAMVRARRAEPATRLLFALVGEYHNVAPQWAEAPPAPPPPDLVETAKALLVKDMDDRIEVYFDAAVANAKGARGRLALFWRRAFPPRHVVAHYARRSPASIGLWLWYPVRLADHGGRYLAARFDRRRRDQVERERSLAAWIEQGRSR